MRKKGRKRKREGKREKGKGKEKEKEKKKKNSYTKTNSVCILVDGRVGVHEGNILCFNVVLFEFN